MIWSLHFLGNVNEDGDAESKFHDDPKAYFRQLYFESIDLSVNWISERFQQPGYIIYSNLEQLLLKAVKGDDFPREFDTVCKMYKDDANPQFLQAQLPLELNFNNFKSMMV